MEAYGSGTILVIKRDGSTEALDVRKLAGSLWRTMQPQGATYRQACDLAGAIEIYLAKSGAKRVSSAAIFEMSVKVLNRVGLNQSANALECHRLRRAEGRMRLRVRHDCGNVTYWDKSWLADLASHSWHVSPPVARIIAGQMEQQLLTGADQEMPRHVLLEMLNERMAEFGLADAVPVRQ